MKLYTLKFLIIVMVAMLIAGTAVDVNAKKRTAKTSARPITALADNIRAIESTKVDSYNDCKEYKSNIEAQALPCFKKSYNPKAVTTEQKVKAVLAQLGKYAENMLESGSTFEMADAGYVHKVIHDYNTLTCQEQMLGKKCLARVLRQRELSRILWWLNGITWCVGQPMVACRDARRRHKNIEQEWLECQSHTGRHERYFHNCLNHDS